MRDPVRSIVALCMTFSVVMVLSAPCSGFAQVKNQDPVAITGMIESVDKSYTMMVINELPIVLTSATAVVDEKGSSLTLKDLKPKLRVRTEAIKTREGYQAVRIVIRTVTKP